VRVRGRVLNQYLYLNTWTRDLTAETRDLRTNSLLRMRCHRIPTLRLLHITRFESDLGAVDLAIDLVVAVDESDVLSLGAALERAGAAA